MSLVPYMRIEKEQEGTTQNIAVPYSPIKTTLLFSVFYFGA